MYKSSMSKVYNILQATMYNSCMSKVYKLQATTYKSSMRVIQGEQEEAIVGQKDRD